MHPSNEIRNLRRRVNRVRNFPTQTCPASRHLHIMADSLTMGTKKYPMFEEEPEHCATSIYAVLESLWKARAKIAALEKHSEKVGA